MLKSVIITLIKINILLKGRISLIYLILFLKSMNKKSFFNFQKIHCLFLAVIFVLSTALPAQAFYLEVPKTLKDNAKKEKKQSSRLLAQEDSLLPQHDNQNIAQPYNALPANQTQNINTQTCNINGVETPGPCPDGQSNQEQNYNQQNEERMKQDQERQMKDMKNGIRQMDNNYKRLEAMLKQAEKNGTAISTEIKEKFSKVKEMIARLNSAQNIEETQEVDMDELQNLMRDLDDTREELIDSVQRVKQMKRGVGGMEQGIKMFEKQIKKLSKQKVAIPQEILDTLSQVKSMIEIIKKAKTWQEIEDAGIEDLQDLMQTLDENRGQLEMLARWPETLKHVNRELNKLYREFKRSKSMVERLKKQDIDISDIYGNFETTLVKFNFAKKDAEQQIASSDAEAAFQILEDDIFNQMEDAWQYQRIIQMVSNLGRFNNEFKRMIKEGQNDIRMLKKKKIDTKELEIQLNQINIKGKEILDVIKKKPLNEDEIIDALQEIEGMVQNFDDSVAELTGEGEVMPWEGGQQQFNSLEIPHDWNTILPEKQENKPEKENEVK